MRLNIISHGPSWMEDPSLYSPETLNLPATVSCQGMFLEAGVPHITLSEMLSPRDFQEIWKECATLVWSALHVGKPSHFEDVPDFIEIHAYSLFCLLGQIRVVERALDNLLLKSPITEVQIEEPHQQDPEPNLFYSAEMSAYYHDVAKSWADRHRLSLLTRRVSFVKQCSHKKTWAAQWRGKIVEIQNVWNRAFKVFVFEKSLIYQIGAWFQWIFNQRKHRGIIFSIPQFSTGLKVHGQVYFRNAQSIISRTISRNRGDFTDHFPSVDRLRISLSFSLGKLMPLVENRWNDHLRRTALMGLSIYHGFIHELNDLTRTGKRAAFLGSSPWVDWPGWGYAAAAFRRLGFPVAGVQHGGNENVVQKAGVPVPFAQGVGGTFFVWGSGGPDELSFYGLESGTKYVRAGSPRMKELRNRAVKKPAPGVGRILYAPTFINVMTMLGDQIPWDAYVPHFLEVCKRLNSSGRPVWMKILDRPEMKQLHLERFKNLIVLHKGIFSDYMLDADYLLTDSLGGSPIYEALATERPILLYTGNKNQSFDKGFLEALQKRVSCFWTSSSYLDGLNVFLRDPEAFFSSYKINLEVVEKYLTPTSPELFWGIVNKNLFFEPVHDIVLADGFLVK